MPELFPIACGIAAGTLVGYLRPALRLPAGALLSIVLGTLATVISGEATVSWAFLAIDIPQVAICAAAANVLVRRARIRTHDPH